METNKHFINEERISLGSVIKTIQDWVLSMLRAWKQIILGAVIIGGLYFAYQMLKKTEYTAQTTFVLETESSMGLGGQLSSLANLAGVSLGSLTESSSVFQLDNIMELYRSYRMLKKTLLSEADLGNGSERLITHYAREAKLISDWEPLGIDFEIPEMQMVVKHDSVLKEVVEDILEQNLVVGKPKRKLTILSVAYTAEDQRFAKAFNKQLVAHVNDFYLETKTKKTGENLRVLTHQADSVKKVLDAALLELARFEEENPNINPLRQKARVPLQKIQIDVRSSGVVYQEIVKNLELAKVAHRNNLPLIQIIDEPIFPLEDNCMKWYKALVIGLIIGGFLMVAFLTMKSVYRSAMEY